MTRAHLNNPPSTEAAQEKGANNSAPPTTLPLLYRDEQLVVIDKPAWTVVHPTRGAEAIPALNTLLSSQIGQAVLPIHRLDCQTSGALVFATDEAAAATLSRDLAEGRWHKDYLALCRGPVTGPQRIERTVPEEHREHQAITDILPLEHFCKRFTLVKATPLTGRRHQIRFHLKQEGFPIVGDTNYGKGPINRYFRDQFQLNRLFLHAAELTLPHPSRAETLRFAVPLPVLLEDVLTGLRRLKQVPV